MKKLVPDGQRTSLNFTLKAHLISHKSPGPGELKVRTGLDTGTEGEEKP